MAVNVYKESIRQVDQCLSRIARNLPSANKMVFFDGQETREIVELARGLGFEVCVGQNLGRNRTWHLWWLRMLRFFAQTSSAYALKLDPDTMVDRPPERMPDADYFGQIQHSFYGFPFIQGGVTGLSLHAVLSLVENRLLERGEMANKVWFTVRLSPSAAFADDQLLALALNHVGIQPVQWDECVSQWKMPVLNDPITHSIVHPRYY